MMRFNRASPATIPEAIDLLEQHLTEKDKQLICMAGPDGCHHTLGRDIRNGWGLWMSCAPIVRWSDTTYGVTHADDISGLILGGLHARLCGEAFDFDAEAASYRLHWEQQPDGASFPGKLLPDTLVFPNHPVMGRADGEAPRKRGLIQRLFGARR